MLAQDGYLLPVPILLVESQIVVQMADVIVCVLAAVRPDGRGPHLHIGVESSDTPHGLPMARNILVQNVARVGPVHLVHLWIWRKRNAIPAGRRSAIAHLAVMVLTCELPAIY